MIYSRRISIVWLYVSTDRFLFYRYFRENWSVAIYHDRFTDVRREVREILKKTLVKKGDKNKFFVRIFFLQMDGDESILQSLANTIDHDLIVNKKTNRKFHWFIQQFRFSFFSMSVCDDQFVIITWKDICRWILWSISVREKELKWHFPLFTDEILFEKMISIQN